MPDGMLSILCMQLRSDGVDARVDSHERTTGSNRREFLKRAGLLAIAVPAAGAALDACASGATAAKASTIRVGWAIELDTMNPVPSYRTDPGRLGNRPEPHEPADDLQHRGGRGPAAGVRQPDPYRPEPQARARTRHLLDLQR